MANRSYLRTNPEFSGITHDTTRDCVIWVMGVDVARGVAEMHKNYGEKDLAHEDERELLAAADAVDPPFDEEPE